MRGRLCLAFPEPYTIGMSHYGLQVLYAIMNGRSDWACERVFTPLADLESVAPRTGTAAGQPGKLHAAVRSSTSWASACNTSSAPRTC